MRTEQPVTLLFFFVTAKKGPTGVSESSDCVVIIHLGIFLQSHNYLISLLIRRLAFTDRVACLVRGGVEFQWSKLRMCCLKVPPKSFRSLFRSDLSLDEKVLIVLKSYAN